MANQNRATAARPPGAQRPSAASFPASARLPAPEAITRIMLRPLGRRGWARTSLEGDLGHQIEHAERGPGVRRQR